MAGRYKPYPEYKDSGVEWLGKIPSSWTVNRLAYIFTQSNAGEVIDKSHWGDGDEILYTCNRTPLLSDYIGFPKEKRTGKNDLLLTRNGTPYVHKPVLNAIYSNVVQRISLSERFDRDYLALCLSNSATNLKGYGVSIESLNFENWKTLSFAYPDKLNQRKIVEFLDHETANIDTLIEKQQQLIQLLKEKRQAVISHAVTKGLNPNAKMKDSGVEWLGEVPEGWGIGKLCHYASISNGATPSRENLAYWTDGTIGWLNSSKVNDITIEEADQFITPLAVSQTSVKPVKENDLVIAITGEGQTRGRVAICKTSATINQHLACVSVNHELINYEYLFYWLTSQYERIRFESSGAGSTKGAITCEDIKSYPLPVPDLIEQQDIVSFIAKAVRKFDSLIELSENQVTLSQERRTALISAAVTGKIDVRNWVAPNESQTNKEEAA